MNTNTRKLHDLGQRIWLDNITREMLNNGTFCLRGVERRIKAGLDPKVESVASLFVSRWDVLVKEDVQLELHSGLGVAIAMRTYKAYCDLLASERWQRLAAAGARPQRLLWASTGMKDPAAPDTFYVEAPRGGTDHRHDPGEDAARLRRRRQGWRDLAGRWRLRGGGYAEAVLDEFKREGVPTKRLPRGCSARAFRLLPNRGAA